MISPLEYLKDIRRRLLGMYYIADLSKVELIRNSDIKYLSDRDKVVNDLFPKLGISNERSKVGNFPDELTSYTGYGLAIWQYPIQYGEYLLKLSKLKINSYLEIGTRHGGTFILTVEYLNKFNNLNNAVGLDFFDCPSLKKYRKKLNKKIRFLRMDTKTNAFKRLLEKEKHFDLVFIDGDAKGYRRDFFNVKDYANAIALTTIVKNYDNQQGYELWQELKKNYKDEFEFYEFTKQYPSVIKKTKNKFRGIGLVVKKSYLKKIKNEK